MRLESDTAKKAECLPDDPLTVGTQRPVHSLAPENHRPRRNPATATPTTTTAPAQHPPMTPPHSRTSRSPTPALVSAYYSRRYSGSPPANQTPAARVSGSTKASESATLRSNVWITVTFFAPSALS